MDFVIPYVNSNEPVWQKQYIDTKRKMNLPTEVGSQRFRDWGNLVYIFRGIEKFMPYIDKIHLIVSNKEQIPEWLNTEKINIVLHEDIIPKEYLPTFNSCTIEMFLHNIPNLSEKFIYSNDDIFILKEIKEQELFEGEFPKLQLIETNNTDNTMYRKVMFNEYKNVAKLFNKIVDSTQWYKPEHGLNAVNLTTVRETYSKLERKILDSCTKFRETKNMNQNIYTYYSFFSNKYRTSNRSFKYFDFSNGIIKNLNEITNAINKQEYQSICINDNVDFTAMPSTFNICKDKINEALNNILPNPSQYEKCTPVQEIQTSDIDFVFPYVTSDDPYWQELYKNNVANENGWAAGIERFRDSGTLKYLFRSLEKNMPWINKVHMLVCADSQVPSWINREYVNIITHDQFIPKEYLPTFNSTTIEMFLPNLKGVNEKFIYSNDDLFTFRKLSIGYFFRGDNPSYQISLRNLIETAPGDAIRRNCYNLITENPSNTSRVVTTQHGTISYRLSWLKECYKKYNNQILNACTKFRDNKNFNQYIYAFYQMFQKYINNSEKKIACYVTNEKQMQKILNTNFTTYDFVCINDDNSTSEEDWKKILNKLEQYFPKKSKYEL